MYAEIDWNMMKLTGIGCTSQAYVVIGLNILELASFCGNRMD